jgi:predicted transcriptional regulator
LLKHPEGLTVKEISNSLKITEYSIRFALNMMVETGYIKKYLIQSQRLYKLNEEKLNE